MATAFGGTAQTYCLWAQVGEPFKEGKVMYINMLHPLTKRPKKVRWYTDKKHADLMPKSKSTQKPFCSVFGFADTDSTILAIKERDLSTTEVEELFASKWRFCVMFGGIWYAPEGTQLPEIKRQTKYFHPTWAEFKAEGQRNSTALGLVPPSDSPWFKD